MTSGLASTRLTHGTGATPWNGPDVTAALPPYSGFHCDEASSTTPPPGPDSVAVPSTTPPTVPVRVPQRLMSGWPAWSGLRASIGGALLDDSPGASGAGGDYGGG
ncbi:hypothetical protein ACFFV7_27675 [Nonomuraea spiralis]|uniref:Uncharacterized protein n=1 Tax=Nonomuraea spiralis TaxID=46182 RepID=A0ABV5IKF1_9ACTN|nr:hypothetical protein [Nonomuraea spiralis]